MLAPWVVLLGQFLHHTAGLLLLQYEAAVTAAGGVEGGQGASRSQGGAIVMRPMSGWQLSLAEYTRQSIGVLQAMGQEWQDSGRFAGKVHSGHTAANSQQQQQQQQQGQSGMSLTATGAGAWPPAALWLQHCSLDVEFASLASMSLVVSNAASLCVLAPVLGELQRLGAALCAKLPVPWLCNNPGCTSMAGASELQLVGGKACVCGGCRAAR